MVRQYLFVSLAGPCKQRGKFRARIIAENGAWEC